MLAAFGGNATYPFDRSEVGERRAPWKPGLVARERRWRSMWDCYTDEPLGRRDLVGCGPPRGLATNVHSQGAPPPGLVSSKHAGAGLQGFSSTSRGPSSSLRSERDPVMAASMPPCVHRPLYPTPIDMLPDRFAKPPKGGSASGSSRALPGAAAPVAHTVDYPDDTPPPEVVLARQMGRLASALLQKYGTIEDAFKAFDVNNSGTLSMSEFSEGCSHRVNVGIDARAIFKALDDDSGGNISVTEFHILAAAAATAAELAMAYSASAPSLHACTLNAESAEDRAETFRRNVSAEAYRMNPAKAAVWAHWTPKAVLVQQDRKPSQYPFRPTPGAKGKGQFVSCPCGPGDLSAPSSPYASRPAKPAARRR